MIAVDANGADQGPGAVAEGVRRTGIPVRLFGPRAELDGAGPHAEVVDAPEAIKGGDEPVAAVRSRRNASIVLAAQAVAGGEADALVSAGSTGPTLAAGTLTIRRIRGVFRPALAVLLPLPHGDVLLLDAGASVEVRPEHLVQFAYLGADVIVTDGFTGNVALKVLEATAKTLTGAIRDAIRSGPVSSIGGALVQGKLAGLRDQLDPERAGGAILLGLRKPVVVAHGSFGPRGIESAVRLARSAVDEDMVGRTTAALESAGALRSAPTATVAQP